MLSFNPPLSWWPSTIGAEHRTSTHRHVRSVGAGPKGHRRTVSVLGLALDSVTIAEALDRIEGLVRDGRRTGRCHQVATINTDFAVKAARDPWLRQILLEADLATADGMPLVWASRMHGAPLPERVTGADLVPALSGRAAARGFSLYLLGAAPGVAEKAADKLRLQYPSLRIVGVASPEIDDSLNCDPSVIEAIRAARPDVLLVALGNPKQERWIATYRDRLRVPVMIGVGGALDFVAGKTVRAPLLVQRLGLEWVHRLMHNPRRLWRRYVADAVYFTLLFGREWPALHRRTGTTQFDHDPGDVATLDGVTPLDNWGVQVYRVAGSPTAADIARIADGPTMERGGPSIVLELSEAKRLDAPSIAALIRLRKTLQDEGGLLVIAGASPAIKRTLGLVRLQSHFRQTASIPEAVRLLRALTPSPPAAGRRALLSA